MLRMMKKIRSASESDAEVNMTPMLDIVFIMLIFFIVTTTFIREVGLDLTQNKEKKNNDDIASASKAVVVHVCANREVLVDMRVVDIRSVRANVERKLAEEGSALVVVDSEMEAPTKMLVAVMDQARAAKAEVSVSSTPTKCGGSNEKNAAKT